MENPEDSKENLTEHTLRIEESVWKQWTEHNKLIGIKSNGERFRWLVKNDLSSESENGTVQFNFEAAYSQISKLSEESKRLLRLIGDKHLQEVEAIAQHLHIKIDLTNLKENIPKLYAYPVPETEGSWERDDMDMFVQYLEICLKRREIKAQIKIQTDKSKKTDSSTPGTSDTRSAPLFL